MRITEFLTDTTFRQQIQANRAKMVKHNNEIATGKRVIRSSDDNIAFTSGKLIEDLIRRNEQFKLNAGNGLFQARTAQDALDQMTDLLVTIKTRTVEAGSDTKNAGDRANMAELLGSLKRDLIDLANTKFNDLYIFAGTNSDQQPFNEDIGSVGGVESLSNNRPLKVLVGDATIVDTTITGLELRDTGSEDLFEIIQDTIDFMLADDGAGIRDSVDKLDEAVNHLIGLSVRVANNINRLEYTNERLDDRIIDQKGEVSRLTDADIIDSMLNFQNAQTSYEAVLAVQSKMMQTSLLHYLR